MQGTTTPSLNNGSTVIQVGAVNAAATGQVSLFNNTSSITQQSIGNPPANSAAVGQLSIIFGTNSSTVVQH
jgi:hypothetical protein